MEKANRSAAQSPLTCLVIGKGRNDNDGDAVARCSEVILKLKSRHPVQVNIRDQARRLIQPSGLQKLFRRRKYLGGEAERLQKPLQRLEG